MTQISLRILHFCTLAVFCMTLGLPAWAEISLKFKRPQGTGVGWWRMTSVCDKREFIDIHTHVACLGDGKSGCFVSESLKSSARYWGYPVVFGISKAYLQKHGDVAFFEKFSQLLNNSSCVQASVLFSLDGAYDKATGLLDQNRTELIIPNRFVAEGTKKFKNLLWAASVNPYRKDWKAELLYAQQNGAQFIKLIPAIMAFQPNDPDLIPYYKELVRLNLPILIHLDEEGSFSRSYNEYTGVHKIELALQQGVKVIAAHVASRGHSDVPSGFLGESHKDSVRDSVSLDNYEQLKILAKNPAYKENLFVDISGLPMALTRERDLFRVVDDLKLWRERILWGSDYPLNYWALTSWYIPGLKREYNQRLRDRGWDPISSWTLLTERWDRQILLQYAMGIEEEIFHHTKAFLLKQGRLREVNGELRMEKP